MAGGIWSSQNKVRAGAYINVESALPDGDGLVTGRVLLATELDTGWGAKGAISVDKSSNFELLFGASLASKKLTVLREALRGAKSVVVVNNNGNSDDGASKATGGKSPLFVDAKHGGEQGNNITIDLVAEEDGEHVTVTTLFKNKPIDAQRIAHLKELESNDIVDFESKGDDEMLASEFFKGQSTIQLTGGTTAHADMTQLLGDALQTEFYNVATTAGYASDNPIHDLLVEMVREVRDATGYKVTAVVPKGATTYNKDFVSVVANGVKLADGTILDPTVASAGFAGYSSNISMAQSLTYKPYGEAVDTVPKMTNESIINALNKGRIVFSKRKSGEVVIESDINSLVNDKTKLDSFKKNKIIRILDYIANDTQNVFENSFIGKVSNNADGRALFKGNRLAFFKTIAEQGLIEPIKPEELVISKGIASDAIVVDVAVIPVDAIEKLYMTITVNQ